MEENLQQYGKNCQGKEQQKGTKFEKISQSPKF